MLQRALEIAVLCVVAAVLMGTPVFAEGEVSAGEDGFQITESDEFTLKAHFFVQFAATRGRTKLDFRGGLYKWINSRPEFEDRQDTRLDNQANFDIRRARVIFEGKAFFEWLRYKVQVENSGASNTTELLDGYVALDAGKNLEFQFGQFKAPFDAFEIASAWRLLFVERPVGTRRFAPSRDVGLLARWRSKSKRWNATYAIQNGNGRNMPNTDGGMMQTLRLEIQNKDGFDYNMSAIDHPSDWQYAAGVAFLENSDGVLVDEIGGPCVMGIAKQCAFTTRNQTAYEAFFIGRGSAYQFTSNYQVWRIDDARMIDLAGTLDRAELEIVQAELSVFTSDRFEGVVRLAKISSSDQSLINPPFGPPVLTSPFLVAEPRPNYLLGKSRVREFSVGMNYYLRKQNARIHLGWSKQKDRTEVLDIFRSYVPDLGRGEGRPITDRLNKIRGGSVDTRNSVWTAMISFRI